MFRSLYERVITWSKHPKAPAFLAAISFTESSFFPIPPDVMLVTMGLARPSRALHYSFITVLFSVLGALFGYLIGYFLFIYVHPIIRYGGYEPSFIEVQNWFQDWGFWAMAIAGFTPIPFKLFTITAGVVQMNVIQFILGSLIGRASRFYLVGGLLYTFGARIDKVLLAHLESIGWVVLLASIVLIIIWHVPT